MECHLLEQFSPDHLCMLQHPPSPTMVGIIGYNIIKGTWVTKSIIAVIDVVHVRHSGVGAGMVLSSHVSSSVVCSRLTYVQSIPTYINICISF